MESTDPAAVRRRRAAGTPLPTSPSQQRRERPPLADVALAGALFGFVLFMLAFYTSPSYTTDVGGVLLFSVALCVPLAWRCSRPVPSAAVIFGVAFLQVLTPGTGLFPANLAVLFAVYALSAYGPDWARPAALLIGLVGALVAVLRYGGPFPGIWEAVFNVAFLGMAVLVVWGLSLLRSSQLARAEAVQEQARLVEVEREQQMRLVAQAERARIARDLHDVVAHSLAVMITQADGGRYAARSHPESAVQALQTISDTGRTALSEMRRLLGVLRDETQTASATAPQPGLEDLAGLVDGLRSGGLAVTLESRGEPVALPQGMGLAAYRIVQEGLTNVLKHAGSEATARVHLWWSPAELTVDVVDDGRGAATVAPGDGPGHGLLGMRERAAVYGGSVKAGPMPGGGFGVRAVFPLAFTPAAMPGVRT